MGLLGEPRGRSQGEELGTPAKACERGILEIQAGRALRELRPCRHLDRQFLSKNHAAKPLADPQPTARDDKCLLWFQAIGN